MTLPTTGPLSILNIYNEKRSRSQSTDEPANDDEHLSLTGLSVDGTVVNPIGSNNARDYIHDGDDRFIDGTPSGVAPHSISEFRGYSQFNWSTSVIYAPSTIFSQNHSLNFGATATANTQLLVTWNQNNSHTAQWRDFTGTSPSTSYSAAQSFTSSNNPTNLEVRWRFANYTRFLSTAADSSETCTVNFHSQNATPFTGSSSPGVNLSYISSWQAVRPYAFGGNNANAQTSLLRVQATGGNTDAGDIISISIPANSLTSFVQVDYRANGDDTKIISFRNNRTSGVNLTADSYYETPDFTCIMPDMLVVANGKFKRVGDVQVGDMIRAQKNLYDRSAGDMDVMVKESRAHTRSGYWDVGGIHITNDHPVWLTDHTHSAWVKVEDMRTEIERTYIEGSVDPIYLETVPGWYYVFSADKSKVFTVSGNYATTTE